MGYVIAAYGLVIGAVAGYALYLDRQRRALRRALPGLSERKAG